MAGRYSQHGHFFQVMRRNAKNYQPDASHCGNFGFKLNTIARPFSTLARGLLAPKLFASLSDVATYILDIIEPLATVDAGPPTNRQIRHVPSLEGPTSL